MNELEAYGKKGMFIRYNENSKAYKIYVLGQKYVEASYDVNFDEDNFLRKAIYLPILRKDDDDVAKNKMNL